MDLMNMAEKHIWSKSSFQHWMACDQLAAAVMLRKEVVLKSQSCRASVELHGQHTRGQFIIDHLSQAQHNVTIVQKVDVNLIKQMLMWAMKHGS